MTLDRTQPPVPGPLNKIPFPQVDQLALDNGIPVHNIQYGSDELVVIYAVFGAGKGYEQSPGVAGMTCRMLTEGTKNHTAFSLGQELDFYGLRLEVNSGYENISVEMTSLTKHLASAVPLMAEIIQDATLPEHEFEQFKIRTMQRIEVQEQKTDFLARREFGKKIFSEAHPYGRIEGKAEVEATQLDQLKAYYQRHFALNNLFFIVAGQVDPSVFLPLLNQYFGSVDLSSLPPVPTTGAQIPLPQNVAGRHFIEMPDSMQSTVRVGHIGFKRSHPDYQRMAVVNTVLGGYFGSRLMRNIREERGYTYGVGSGWLSLKHNGIFIVQTDVGTQYVEDTLTQIRHEINLLRDEGVGAEELNIVKNYMLGNLGSSRETQSQVAGTLKNLLVNAVPLEKLNEKFEVIQSITPEEVQQLANQYLHPDRLLEVVCGGKGTA